MKPKAVYHEGTKGVEGKVKNLMKRIIFVFLRVLPVAQRFVVIILLKSKAVLPRRVKKEGQKIIKSVILAFLRDLRVAQRFVINIFHFETFKTWLAYNDK